MSLIMFGGTPITVSGNFTTASIQDNCKPGNSWKIVVPEATINYIKNPSAETTANYSAYGTALVTRVSSVQKYGLYSYFVQTIAANDGLVLDLETLTLSSPYFLTVRVKGDLPDLTAALDGGAVAKLRFIERIDREWILMGCQFSADLAVSSTQLAIYTTEVGLFDIYLDGIQLEPHSFWTTYCDGTQEGCAWSGTAHASISTRSEFIRAGGRTADLFEECKFFVKHIVGAGATPIAVDIDEFAILPGGELNNIKVQPRDFNLVGEFHADSESDLHRSRQTLLGLLDDEGYPGQPVKLIFSGAEVQKEIKVHYKGGLEGDLAAFYQNFEATDNNWTRLLKYTEKASIQLLAPDPMWYGVGEAASQLASANQATFTLVAGRLQSLGNWDNLGPPSAYTDNGDGFTVAVKAIADDANYIYMGGNWINFDGIAGADNIVRYNKVTGVYSDMDGGLDNTVYDIKVAPDGKVYACGAFVYEGGGGLGTFFSGVACWNPVTEAWSVLDQGLDIGLNGAAYAMAFDIFGNLIIVGTFVQAFPAVANTAYIAKWNPVTAAWSSVVTTGLDDIGRGVVVSSFDNTIYVTGDFANVGGVATPGYVAKIVDSTAYALPSGGLTDAGMAVAFDPITGYIYFGSIGGNSELIVYRGDTKIVLSDVDVYTLDVSSSGILYVGGFFTSIGGVSVADMVAAYNGYSFYHLDIDLPGTPNVYRVWSSRIDGSLYLGFSTTGTGYYSGDSLQVINLGSAKAYPKAIFSRSGGTAAIVEMLRNERTASDVLMNYSLLDGEVLTLDMLPVKKSVISSYFGPKLQAVLPNSSFGSWALLPGSNMIRAFVSLDGATSLVYLLWRNTYKSYD